MSADERTASRAARGVRGIAIVLDVTRVTGVLAFGAAALACATLAISRRPRHPALWASLAVVQMLCAVEVLFGFRYGLHDLANGALLERGWYGSRGDWQALLLGAGVAAICALGLLAAWQSRADRYAAVAIVGAALGVSVLLAETISLHRIDVVMYASLGPFVGLVWMWIAAASMVAAAALATRR
jgi:hypothetical protein